MWCPRLNHFVRFNIDGTVSRCGHMVNSPKFSSLTELNNSQWLNDKINEFSNNQWPAECVRCQEIENINGTSIRLNSIIAHKLHTQPDYLQVAGVLDNICNSACQTCSAELSTKIGSLKSTKYIKIDNSKVFWDLPLNKIEHLDINGGEPSASKNYKYLLKNLPKNLKTLRVNTNCFLLLPELKEIQKAGIDVTLTISFDGINKIHNYIRWPVPWDKFYENLMIYKEYNLHMVNLWTTVSALNINDLENIFQFVSAHKLNHSYALLKSPTELDIAHTNIFTTTAKAKLLNSSYKELQKLAQTLIASNNDNTAEITKFIIEQDTLRGIDIKNFVEIVDKHT